MFGTPIPPASIKAETAYRLERDFRSARRRKPTDQQRLARRVLLAVTTARLLPHTPSLDIRDGVLTPRENPNEIPSQSDCSQPANHQIPEAVSDRS